MNKSVPEFLYSANCEGVTQTVDEVFKKYRSGEQRAPLHFAVSIIVISSGVQNVELKPHDVRDSADMNAVLENLYSCVSSESLAYLLVNKDGQYKHFSQRFSELWKYFIKTAFSAEILFQDGMMPSMALWLVAISESKCRSFRHTATVGVLDMIQALNEIAEILKARLTFVREPDEMVGVKQNLDQIMQWRDHLFSQTVHQRLRDIAPEIRLAAIQQLRNWVCTFPEEYMEKQYLRYFSMSLHDKKPSLRVEGLEMIIQGLGRVEGAYERMKLFLEYFIQRLVEMCNDVDTRCAELALRVLAMIVKRSAEHQHSSGEFVTSEMIDAALRALFDERQAVRTAAGVLLHVFVYTRCATEHEEEGIDGETLKVAGNLITSFADTLRKQYKEEMAEKYLVDTLWNAGNPPSVLLETPIMTEYSTSRIPSEAQVGLGFFAAVLQKLQGSMQLGPVPKDDRRLAASKVSSTKKQKLLQLQKKLSVDAIHVLFTVLKIHSGDDVVLRSAAELASCIDVDALTSSAEQSALSEVMTEFRKCCNSSLVSLGKQLLQALTLLWHHFIHVDHPQRSEAEGHIQEIRNLVQLELATMCKASNIGNSKELEVLAARCQMLSSLQPMKEILSSYEVAFGAFLHLPQTPSPAISSAVLATFMNELLWEAKAIGGNSDELHSNTVLKDLSRKLIGICFGAAKETDGTEGNNDEETILLYTLAFNILCDVVSLKLHDFSDTEIDSFFSFFEQTFDKVSTHYRASQEALRDTHLTKVETVQELHQVLHQTRADNYKWDAALLQLVESVRRLFLLKRLSAALAPKFLFFWCRSTSKTVSNFFKTFFYAQRDASGDSFALERDTIGVAYDRAVAVGLTPLSIEEMGQLSAKLSSLHFGLAVDRHYPVCIAMVKHGIDFATSVDPLILHAIVPYCAKLKPPEALHLLRHELPSRDVFKAASHPCVRIFISALSRAAKIGDPLDPSSPATVESRGTLKRGRELTGVDLENIPEETALMDIARAGSFSSPEGKEGALLSRVPNPMAAKAALPRRIITGDGWHVRPDTKSIQPSSPSQSEATQDSLFSQEAVVVTSSRPTARIESTGTSYPIASQEPLLATNMGNEEVFIGTEDYQ